MAMMAGRSLTEPEEENPGCQPKLINLEARLEFPTSGLVDQHHNQSHWISGVFRNWSMGHVKGGW